MTKLTPFNPCDSLLKTDQAMAEYLADCYEDDDPNTFITALGYVAKHEGIAHIAEATGLNRESLYKALSGQHQPRWDTIHRVMKCLNVKLQPVA